MEEEAVIPASRPCVRKEHGYPVEEILAARPRCLTREAVRLRLGLRAHLTPEVAVAKQRSLGLGSQAGNPNKSRTGSSSVTFKI